MQIKRHSFKLKKELGLIQVTFAGLGIILGAGIYTLIGKATGIAGNSVWLSFLISAVLASFTGLTYAELSSMYPKNESEAEYGERAFNKRVGFLLAWLIILTGIVSAATVALGFGGYLAGIIEQYFHLPTIIGAVLCIVIFSIINFWGIKYSSEFNILGTLVEGGGLILVIILGLKYLGKVNYLTTPNGITGIVSAAGLIFFAYLGFGSIVKLSEETKNPTKTIPRAIIYSIIISTIFYVLVAVSAVSILGWQNLAVSKAPLADVTSAVLGNKAFLIIAIIAVFSTANTVLMTLVTTSRIMYGIGKKFKKIKSFSIIHKKTRTPWIAIILTMILTIIFSLIGDIGRVAEITNFIVFITFIILNASLLVLRYKEPNKERPFKAPLNIGKFNLSAFLGVIVSLVLLIYLSRDWKIYVFCFSIILSGLLIYEIIKE